MSEKLFGSIHMSSQRLGHDCTFTWRLRNLSLLSTMPKESVQHEFSLHPKCDTTWVLTTCRISGGYKVYLGTKYSYVPRGITQCYLGLLNAKGVLVLPEDEQTADSSDKICMSLRLWSDEKNSVLVGSDKDMTVVELQDGDTLVVRGRLVVPSCCARTEIDKEGTSATEPLDLCELTEEGFVVP